MQQATSGKSQPSPSTWQLVISSVSPDASRAKAASRSGFGVAPSTCSARTPDFDELVADVQRVCDVHGEADRLPAFAVLVPMGDDVADEVRTVHPIGELAFDIVADAGLDAFQVGIDRRKHARADQMLLLDQLGDLGAFDDDVEDAAEPATVTAARRCRQTEQHRVADIHR